MVQHFTHKNHEKIFNLLILINMFSVKQLKKARIKGELGFKLR